MPREALVDPIISLGALGGSEEAALGTESSEPQASVATEEEEEGDPPLPMPPTGV